MSSWLQESDGSIGLVSGLGAVPAGVSICRIEVADPEVGLLVSGEGESAVPARTTVPVTSADVGRQALYVLENGRADRPIIIGLVRESSVDAPVPAPSLEVEGKRIAIEGKEEVVLRSGEASITLRSDGRIVIKGMDIVSRARGVHKVKGATVLIN
jgi:hypothetical protein